MADVIVSVADYLRNVALFTAAASPSGVAWNERAIESEIISPLKLKADADAEATRQAAFLAGPLVEDVVLVTGARRDLMLKPVTLTGDQLGLDAVGGVPAFVIGFQELEGETSLTVVRSLA
jgi:hypothetical protein